VIDFYYQVHYFSGKKKLEYYYKRVKFGGTSMSCVPPPMYADRFTKFMK